MQDFSRPVPIVAVLFLAVFSLALLGGCGKKGDPVPPRYTLPPAVTDLKASYSDGSITLTWTMPPKAEYISKVRISRSELEVVGEQCPGCPRQFLLIAGFAGGDPRIFLEKEKGYRFVDTAVKTGRLYTYKVILCDSHDLCSGDSNTAEAKMKETP